jgi:hypothetical protein
MQIHELKFPNMDASSFAEQQKLPAHRELTRAAEIAQFESTNERLEPLMRYKKSKEQALLRQIALLVPTGVYINHRHKTFLMGMIEAFVAKNVQYVPENGLESIQAKNAYLWAVYEYMPNIINFIVACSRLVNETAARLEKLEQEFAAIQNSLSAHAAA